VLCLVGHSDNEDFDPETSVSRVLDMPASRRGILRLSNSWPSEAVIMMENMGSQPVLYCVG
jgi:hypothetical protein